MTDQQFIGICLIICAGVAILGAYYQYRLQQTRKVLRELEQQQGGK